jgi:hypothetical protein
MQMHSGRMSYIIFLSALVLETHPEIYGAQLMDFLYYVGYAAISYV